ncbi:MAG: hypothetical protein HC800_21005 [Phormidesmis sp. RL_2_1]|nr:hypothetical protein [Phormidesmis sp. RL_2_1]
MFHFAAKAALPNRQPPAAQVPADATAPAFDELSPDLRYRLLRRRAARGGLFTGAVYLLAAGLLAAVAVPQLNAAADAAIAQLLNLKQKADAAAELISPDFASPVQKGEVIAGYTVTSGYGLRDTSNLPAGASADHKGVDLATPEGTKVYAPGKLGDLVTVRCWTDDGGGGLVAEIESASFPHLWFQALHLEDCKTGVYRAGDDIARTGESGIGAPHLDWRQRERITDKHQHPQKSYLLWALTGREPNANFTRIDILRSAIIGQESGGDSTAVNPDSSALGLGQVMPENLGGPGDGWDFEALGKDLTPEQFLADTDAQNKIINHQLSQTFDAQIAAGKSEDEAIRRTAATWYSGQPDLADDTTPQTYGTGSYPSISDYSDEVLNRVHQLRLERSQSVL